MARPVSASTTAASATSSKWWPLATICVPSSTARSARGEALERGRRARPGFGGGVGVEADPLQSGNVLLELLLEPLRPGADAGELRASRTRGRGRGCGSRVAAVVAAERPVRVQDERDVAARAAARRAAGAAVERRREAAAVEEQDRLAAVARDRASSASSGADSG